MQKHGVSFGAACGVFADAFAIEFDDDRHHASEVRFNTIGVADGHLLFVVSTLREPGYGSFRLVMQNLVNDGDIMNTTRHEWSRLDSMTDEERHAAALADPDAQPLTDADMDRMKQTPRLKIIRRALGLTQEEFSIRFQIPLGTLRDWEQGAAQPDQAARAYLKAIAGDAHAVQQALSAGPRSFA